MNPSELRAEMPALDEGVYLNTGAGSPSPRRVVEATHAALEHHEFEAPTGAGTYEAVLDVVNETRSDVADHLGAGAPENVALTQSTTDGMGRIAAAMDWEPGDVVVRTDLEHAAGILPWRHLRDTVGVEVRTVETEHGRIDVDAFAAAVADAKLAAFSSLTWTHGTRLPVERLTEIAHDAGARVLVDAVQSPGQRPVDVGNWNADAVAGASHKWLLGGFGAGFLYVDPEFARTLDPAQLGYASVEDPYADPITFHPDARRFEIGTGPPGPYAGLQEALSIVESIGYDTITDRIERLTDRLKAGLDDDRLRSPRDYESGLVSFAAENPERTVERLESEGVFVRSIPLSGLVRASVHVFNTAADVDALLDALDVLEA